jgi:N-acetylneuraminic acid mutarotase
MTTHRFARLATFVLCQLAAVLCATSSGLALQGSWTAGANFPTTQVRGQGTWFAPNGRFYVLGGRTSDSAGSDLLNPSEYDPGTNSWSVKSAVFPDNQVNNMVGGVLTDAGTSYIYCVGGSAAGAATSTPDVRRYDPVADVITTVATDPWPAPLNTLPGGGAVFNNRLYVVGGFTIGVGMTDQIWEFDPAALAGSRWTQKAATLPVQMGYIPTALVGNTIYIGGGTTFSAGLLFDSMNSYAYDPLTDVLTTIASIPRATGETRAVNEGGQMWVLGGGRTSPNPSNQVDAYSPGPNSWSLAPSFVTARRNIAADVDPATGNIYMVGGYAPSAATDNMEIFKGCLPTTYCTAKVNSAGCTPAIGSTGTPSATAGSGFVISTSNELDNRNGLYFYSKTGANNAPFQGGFLCALAPLTRTPVQNSGGTPPCNGSYNIDFNAYIAGGADPALVSGQQVWIQTWSRDPASASTTNLSDALTFVICP